MVNKGEAFLNNVYLHGGCYYGEFAYKGDQSFDEVNWKDYYPTAGRNFAAMYVGTESGSTAYSERLLPEPFGCVD